jgi:hypothetical protein
MVCSRKGRLELVSKLSEEGLNKGEATHHGGAFVMENEGEKKRLFGIKGGAGLNAAPEVIATIVAWKCTKKEIYTLYGRFARGGRGPKPQFIF